MIRLLLIGPEASSWSARITSVAPAIDVEAARLPAAAVRSFEQTPPDAVCYCWASDDDRLTQIAGAIRTRPLGSLVPSILIGEAQLDDVELRFGAEEDPAAVVSAIAELLGLSFDEVQGEKEEPATDDEPGAEPVKPGGESGQEEPTERVGEAVIEQKLREVRHESYFVILETSADATAQQLREAYDRLARKFAAAQISPDLTRKLGAELDEVREGLEDAYVVLSDERLRETFQR